MAVAHLKIINLSCLQKVKAVEKSELTVKRDLNEQEKEEVCISKAFLFRFLLDVIFSNGENVSSSGEEQA